MKNNNLKNILSILNDNIISPSQIKEIVSILVTIVKDSKESNEKVSQETKDNLRKVVGYLDAEHIKLIQKLNLETSEKLSINEKKVLNILNEAKRTFKEIKNLMPKDGYTPKKGEDYFTDIDKNEIIANTIETLKTKEKLTAKDIDGLEDLIKKTGELGVKEARGILSLMPKNPPIYGGGSGATFLKSMRDLDLTGLSNGDVIKWDASKKKFVVGAGGTGVVDSVNGQTGEVVLDADDISDTSTTNKFTNAIDISRLANTSGTNTGDQDLSGYALKNNVLALNNTTPFTPDADYEPATKKYVDDNGGSYTLPTASATTLGGIKVGTRLSIDGNGVLSADVQAGGGDMLASTYDPAGGAKQVAFADELHNPVTVTDSTEIDFTLTGQDITASLKTGSIDVLKLDSDVQTSLGKADTALQSETDPLSLHLDQTTPQNIINGIPLLTADLSDFTSGSQIVNKEYVDSVLDFEQTYYFNNTASSIGGIYYKMLDMPTGEAEATFVSSALGTGDNQALVNFATDAGQPGTTIAKSGIYTAHIHAHKASAGGKPVQIYYAIYNRNLAGTETLLATSEISELLTTDKTGYDLHATLVSDVPVLTTDRRIIKWFANVGASGTDAIVTLYVEGDNASTLTIPTTTEILSSVFLRQDGTKPLVGNWNAGAYDITASSFVTIDGTSSQFVKGDGSLDSNTYLTSLSGAVLTDQSTPQTIGVTGARLSKLWATDIESTNMPTVGGTPILSSLTAPQFTTIELGHASDTTLSRVSAGVISVEGKTILTSDNIEDSIVDGHTTIAPSGNAVFDALALKAPLASPTFTGTVTLADNARIDLTLPTTDTYVTGNVTNSFNSGYSSAVGDLVFFGSGGKWLEVDADAVATCNGLIGIALEAKTDGQAMLVALPGSFVRLDSWNWTVGATLYAGETLGAMQETIPTGADAIIKVVGFAVSADVIFFNPSPDQQSTVA